MSYNSNSETVDASNSSKSRKVLQILMDQNSQLEREIKRLHIEIDEVTKGILKRGYLYKFRDREISYASKWGLRYFVLQGSSLSYFADDKELRPRRSIDLTGCIVMDEGLKGGYYVFSIYWPTHEEDDADNDRGGNSNQVKDDGTMVGSLLIRLSSANKADAHQWIALLEKSTHGNNILAPEAPAINPDHLPHLHVDVSTPSKEDGTSWNNSINIENVDELIGHDNDPGHVETLKRVRSSNLILQQSLSRSPISAVDSNSATTASSVSATRFTSEISTESTEKENASSFHGNKSRGLQVSKSGRSLLQTHLQSKPATTSGSSSTTKLVDRARRFPASKPIHIECKYSPLSVEGRPSEQNYRGFFNLGVIILILTNFRMIADNLLKYGLLLSIPGWRTLFSYFMHISENSAASSQSENLIVWFNQIIHNLIVPSQCVSSWLLSIGLCYSVEIIASTNRISSRTALLLVWILSIGNILIPCVWTYHGDANPGLSMMYLMQSVILWMKLISYNHVNRDLRKMFRASQRSLKSGSTTPTATATPTTGAPSSPGISRSSSGDALNVSVDNLAELTNAHGRLNIFQEVRDLQPPFLQYPNNLTIGNLLWFCIAPTLCYQLNYPRSSSIRWQYVMTILLRMMITGCFIVFCVEQYISPTLSQSFEALKSRDIPLIVMRLLKLSIPNTYVWLLGFYFYFHLWLNLLAELTRFGDRLFYKDWWNARTIDTYWRTWNLPVHHWMLRHLYYPLLGMGTGKTWATVYVFIFSAVFHEVIISTPFKHFGMHAFLGMLAQAPLIKITNYLDKFMGSPTLGNVVFWCLFCVLGQPMGVILTHYDLSLKHAAAMAASSVIDQCVNGVCTAIK